MKFSLNAPEESLNRIHSVALRILAELGIRLDQPEMRERLAGLGCRVSGEAVCIPPELAEMALRAVPPSFRLYGRDDSQGVRVGGDGPFLCTNTGILPYVYDFETGEVRSSVREDVETTTRVLDALSEIDIVYVSLLDATEVPGHLITLTDLAATLANTTKPLVGPGATTGAEARAIIAMAAAVRGGDRERLAAEPPCALFVAPITPLKFPTDAVDALIEVAHAGLPLMALTNPVMGATAPYSIAGTVALAHAEILATIVMAYAVRPGLPILNFSAPTVADMRTISSTSGGPETGLMRALAVSLARSLGIPAWGHGHTSSTRLDEQASDEKSINQLLIAQAGPSLLGGLGGLANVTLTSYETLVLDNERFAALRRVMRGVVVDDEHLALDVLADMMRGEEVIRHDHTLNMLHGDEVWRPRLARRQGLVGGAPDAKSARERAREEARRMMEQHVVAPLPAAVQAEMDEIIAAYDRDHGQKA